MIQPAFEILNQRGTPMFFSDVYSNLPTAGVVGRIFIRTDSPYGIYRDNGSSWDQIAGSGGGGISGSGAAGQVTFWDGTASVSGSNNLWWDNTTNKFLVGTNNATGVGSAQITSSTGDSHLRVWGSTSPSIRIDNAVSAATQRFAIGLATATNNFIQGSTAGDICITTASANPLLFGMWQTTNATEVMRISTGSRLLIGTTTDAGWKLDVVGTFRSNMTGTGAGNVGFNVVSGSTNYLRIFGSGKLGIGSNSFEYPQIYSTSTTASSVDLNGQFISFSINNGTTQSTGNSGGFCIVSGNDSTITSGIYNNIFISKNFAPTSGTGVHNQLLIQGTINQTGGASGVSRGIYIAPTITAASDWRTIEWTNNSGFGLYGSGTVKNYLNGNLLLGTTTDAGFKLDVVGTSRFTYSSVGITNSGFAILNSTSNVFRCLGDGAIAIGNSTFSAPRILPITTSQASINLNGANLSFYNLSSGDATGTAGAFSFSGSTYNSITTGNINNVSSVRTFAPTSGTTTHNNIYIEPTINQTGGANGITRSLYINPTLTSAADFRTIEWTNNSGFGLYGSGTAPNYLNGNLNIASTSNPGQKLYVNGSVRIDGQTAATAGGSAGLHLIVNLDGTNYKIALLNV